MVFKANKKQLSDKTAPEALANVSAGLASADDIRVGGKTLNENVDALVARMNQEGKEPTLADVQDDAIKLLGFDPKELEGEFEEDRKASIFLNMMKAGLAIANFWRKSKRHIKYSKRFHSWTARLRTRCQ